MKWKEETFDSRLFHVRWNCSQRLRDYFRPLSLCQILFANEYPQNAAPKRIQSFKIRCHALGKTKMVTFIRPTGNEWRWYSGRRGSFPAMRRLRLMSLNRLLDRRFSAYAGLNLRYVAKGFNRCKSCRYSETKGSEQALCKLTVIYLWLHLTVGRLSASNSWSDIRPPIYKLLSSIFTQSTHKIQH